MLRKEIVYLAPLPQIHLVGTVAVTLLKLSQLEFQHLTCAVQTMETDCKHKVVTILGMHE